MPIEIANPDSLVRWFVGFLIVAFVVFYVLLPYLPGPRPRRFGRFRISSKKESHDE